MGGVKEKKTSGSRIKTKNSMANCSKAPRFLARSDCSADEAPGLARTGEDGSKPGARGERSEAP